MIFEIKNLHLLMVLSLLIGVCIGIGSVKISEVNQPVDQTLLNETYLYGYNMGIVDTSQSILETGLLPVFNITEEGIEHLGNINLTERLE